MNIRNVAIIAHVDHGKTTIVDGLLKQSKTFRDNELLMTQTLIMDSNDQERERGITILAKNTAVTYKDTKINIIDTPGHSDFGGEVERTLNMADGALLVVDAQEGPMPQTKFVLKKALELNLKIIVIINKVDKKDAAINSTLNKIYDLFLELATKESQLEFPVLYAIGRDGKAWDDFNAKSLNELIEQPADFTPIFDAIIKHVPQPTSQNEEPLQMLISTLDWDNYKGKYAIGRITNGVVKPGMHAMLIHSGVDNEKVVIDKVFVNQGLKRIETEVGMSGDVVSVTGIKNANIGDTLCDPENPKALPTIKIEEPTLAISVGPNTSPFLGKEGSLLTGRQILERIEQELQTNVAMKFNIEKNGQYVLLGRGELHLSVFLETLRREGFELSVGKPKVITKIVDGKDMEPIEELTVDIDNSYVGSLKSELGKRHGVLISQDELTTMSSRLVFEIPTRGILGLRSVLLTLSKGTAVLSSMFIRYEKVGAAIPKLRKGALIASHSGKAVPYGLVSAHSKGSVFISPQTQVYQGMIIGLNGRDEDLEINVCKEKQLTNNRSVGEEGITIPPAVEMSLEQYLSFIEEDELLEITPSALRLRKKILDLNLRRRSASRGE